MPAFVYGACRRTIFTTDPDYVRFLSGKDNTADEVDCAVNTLVGLYKQEATLKV